ncbi:60 kDa chaperonin [archaeon BMS3Abin16]|nr:60 kDa chaperonin [archaeon BMS3Abin16]GBE56634.1 60 kDa chaperonin [archaeon BMS3Bbin16]HDZ61527.1 thermosome subunit [Nitrospirota bacterium]
MSSQLSGQPILILKEGVERKRGRDAQSTNIMAAKVIADTVKSTLGPRGMDKMLVGSMGDIVVTNDGATILKEIDIEHPAAKMMVEVAKTQENEVGDGTTTAVVLAGELLKKAEDLIEQEIHPTVIAKGYRMAATKAKEIATEASVDISVDDDEIIRKVAMTAMTGKGAEKAKELLADIVVEAVKSVSVVKGSEVTVDKDQIKLEKKEGEGIENTELIRGVVIDKERVHSAMPKSVKDAKIALVDSAMEVKKTEIDAKINITDPNQLQAFLDEEEGMLKDMVERVKDSGANVLFAQKGIDDLAQHYLAKAGIFAIRRVKESDMKKLSKATGARIVSTLDDLSSDNLGVAGLVEEVKIGDDAMTFVRDCKDPKSVSILVRGGTEHIVDEVERALDDAIGVVASVFRDKKVVSGGGAAEVEIARGLREYAKGVGGREQLAIEAYADAMEVIPRALAENAGLDPIDVIVELRSENQKRGAKIGIDVFDGKAKDMYAEGIIEPLSVKTQAIDSSSEIAVMILRIDDLIAASSLGGGGAGGPPDMGDMGY